MRRREKGRQSAAGGRRLQGGFWAIGAPQRKDSASLGSSPLSSLTSGLSGSHETLGSYQHRTGWCGATDGASWRCVMTETNEAVPCHGGCRGWWRRAVVEENSSGCHGREPSWSRAVFSFKSRRGEKVDELIYADEFYTQAKTNEFEDLQHGWGLHVWHNLMIGFPENEWDNSFLTVEIAFFFFPRAFSCIWRSFPADVCSAVCSGQTLLVVSSK